jgi:hypothetical protein
MEHSGGSSAVCGRGERRGRKPGNQARGTPEGCATRNRSADIGACSLLPFVLSGQLITCLSNTRLRGVHEVHGERVHKVGRQPGEHGVVEPVKGNRS